MAQVVPIDAPKYAQQLRAHEQANKTASATTRKTAFKETEKTGLVVVKNGVKHYLGGKKAPAKKKGPVKKAAKRK
jgi:hypothetical protein